jgi:hypothetical protein
LIFLRFRFGSIGFVAFWRGRFWCEAGAVLGRRRKGRRIKPERMSFQRFTCDVARLTSVVALIDALQGCNILL